MVDDQLSLSDAEREVAEFAVMIEKRLVREADRMAAECGHPPCQHAEGLRLALHSVDRAFRDWAATSEAGLPREPSPRPLSLSPDKKTGNHPKRGSKR